MLFNIISFELTAWSEKYSIYLNLFRFLPAQKKFLKKMATLQQQYKTYGLACFEKYRDFQPINETELDVAVNYICEHLNSPTLNYGYWYDMYSYTTKSKIVLRYRKRRGGSPVVKLGECLCQGQVVDFLKNSNKKCNCDNGCASVYFDKVF